MRGRGEGVGVGGGAKMKVRPEVESFFQMVMVDLGYSGWNLRWTESDAFCWRNKKRIDICPMETVDECKQMLLHEIAHIDVIESGCQHTLRFWLHLRDLVQKYLFSDLSKYQRSMASIYFPELRKWRNCHLT